MSASAQPTIQPTMKCTYMCVYHNASWPKSTWWVLAGFLCLQPFFKESAASTIYQQGKQRKKQDVRREYVQHLWPTKCKRCWTPRPGPLYQASCIVSRRDVVSWQNISHHLWTSQPPRCIVSFIEWVLGCEETFDEWANCLPDALICLFCSSCHCLY